MMSRLQFTGRFIFLTTSIYGHEDDANPSMILINLHLFTSIDYIDLKTARKIVGELEAKLGR
jgi:hypothetical protein